jgi:predicted DNA-binding transcriptional regulator AlpA
LGNLFVAVDPTDQKVFVIKTFYSSGGFCVAVKRQYRREFSVRVAPSRDTIYRIIKQFEEAGSVCDKCAKGLKRNASVRMEEVGAAREAVTRSPRKSVRRLAQQIGASTSTAWRVCRDDLSLFPYKMQLS